MAAVVPKGWADEVDGDHTGSVSVVEAPLPSCPSLVSGPALVPACAVWVLVQQTQCGMMCSDMSQPHPTPSCFSVTPFGIVLTLDCHRSSFLVTETKEVERQLQQAQFSKDEKKAFRTGNVDALKVALEECPRASLDEIIKQAFSQEWLPRFWEDASGNYLVQHFLSKASAGQVGPLICHLLANFDALLKKRNAFAGRYIERLSERSDFLDLLNGTGCSFRILVEKIGMQATKWAIHRDGNYALGALLERAPMWFAFEAHHELRFDETNSDSHALFRIALEKAERRVGMRRSCFAISTKRTFLAFESTRLRRTQSTSALNM